MMVVLVFVLIDVIILTAITAIPEAILLEGWSYKAFLLIGGIPYTSANHPHSLQLNAISYVKYHAMVMYTWSLKPPSYGVHIVALSKYFARVSYGTTLGRVYVLTCAVCVAAILALYTSVRLCT